MKSCWNKFIKPSQGGVNFGSHTVGLSLGEAALLLDSFFWVEKSSLRGEVEMKNRPFKLRQPMEESRLGQAQAIRGRGHPSSILPQWTPLGLPSPFLGKPGQGVGLSWGDEAEDQDVAPIVPCYKCSQMGHYQSTLMEYDAGWEVTDRGRVRAKQPPHLLGRVKYKDQELRALLDMGFSVSILCAYLALSSIAVLPQSVVKVINCQDTSVPCD